MSWGAPVSSQRRSRRPPSRQPSTRQAARDTASAAATAGSSSAPQVPVLHQLLALLLVHVGVGPRLGPVQEHHLHGAHDPGVGARARDAHGELAARQVTLHQHRLAEASQQVQAARPQLGRGAQHRTGVDALARPLGQGFGEEGERQVQPVQVRRAGHLGERRGGQARVAQDALGHALVQGQGQHQGIAEGVGDAVHVQQGGHLGLAPDARQPLGDVEDQVPAVARHQPRGQRPGMADAVRLVAQAPQGALELLDGGEAVELGRLLLAVAHGQVVVPQVVGQADPHRATPRLGWGSG